jgi:hypothetical protein
LQGGGRVRQCWLNDEGHDQSDVVVGFGDGSTWTMDKREKKEKKRKRARQEKKKTTK